MKLPEETTEAATLDTPERLKAGLASWMPAQAQLGECALWCERSQSLFWTDINQALLSRWSAGTGALQQWAMPQLLGSFALCEAPDQLLLGLARGLALFDLRTGTLGPVQPLPESAWRTADARINDGRCDPQGRFVFGLFNPHGERTGQFWRVDASLRAEPLPLAAAQIANCLSFSPDGQWLYFTDSPSRCIQRARYHADGRIEAPEVFVQLPLADGEPDGATVDTLGHLWVALWGAGCVLQLDAQGRELQRWPLPVSQPTCPAFGGPALDQLFITSARKELSAETLAREPQAGDVLRLRPGVRGLPAHRFVSAPGVVDAT